MRLAILSDTRMPTLPVGGHGLGRMAFDLAAGLALCGHEVTLMAGMGSDAPEGVRLGIHEDELIRADGLALAAQTGQGGESVYEAYIDLSHEHDLSRLMPDAPVLNWIVDTEVQYQPPNCIVGNKWQARQFKNARIVPLGIDVARYPFVEKPDDYVLYAAKIHPAKGFDIAIEVARQTGSRLVMVGDNLLGVALPPEVDYVGHIADNRVFWAFLAHAKALLSPSRIDAGGRVLLEAAACGVPSLVFDETGCAAHVEHGVSGFACRDTAEMVEALGDVHLIDRCGARAWADAQHGIEDMAAGVEMWAQALANGARW